MPRHVHESLDAGYVYDRQSGGMVRRRSVSASAIIVILIAVFLFLVACAGGCWYSYGRLREQAYVVRDLELSAIDMMAINGGSSRADYIDTLKANLSSAQEKTQQARSLTHNGLWMFYSGLTGYHADVTAFQQMTDTMSDISHRIVTQYTTVLDTVESQSLYTAEGALDVSPINDAMNAVNAMNDALQDAVDSIPVSSNLKDRNLYAAYSKIDSSVNSVLAESSTLSGMFAFLPALLGANGPRTIIILAQASGRGLAAGGPVEAAGWMTAQNGQFNMGNFYAAGNWITGAGEKDVTDDQNRLFNEIAGLRYGQTISQITANPDFPEVAQQANDFWSATDFAGAGADADGVVAFDPYALGQLVGVAGGVTLDDGTKLTETGTAEFLMHGIYQTVKTEDMPAYYTGLVMKIVTGAFSDLTMRKVLMLSDALVTSAQGRHAYLWSFDEQEQGLLRQTRLAGDVGGDEENPVVGVYNEQMHVSHMDWYFNRVSTVEKRGEGYYHVTVSLNNTLGTAIGLSSSIVGTRGGGAEIGHQLQRMLVYTPVGGTILNLTVQSGAKVDTANLGDTVVYTFVTDISMASTDVLEFDVQCGKNAKNLQLDMTPNGAGDQQVTYTTAGEAVDETDDGTDSEE